MSDRQTIFALSSGRPPVAIAVIRISGPRAGAALTALGVKIPAPRTAGLARIRDPRSGEILDEALVLWFPGPRSETGEDVAELQAHGGRAVVAAILDALASIDGLRLAEPGEFTRRGFENGKFDLTAVEGLADLVGADTEGQRRQAFRQMKGVLGNRAETWRMRLIHALALVEARIDFSDEADVPEELVAPALVIARELSDEIAAALADGRRGERLREGMVVAIAGPPNAGKSSLLNRLAQREAAIVSPHAGTTRDVIEVHLDLGGFPVTLLDTAGIRESADPVEMEGIRRALERAASADLVLWMEAAGGGTSALGRARTDNTTDAARASSPPAWLVRSKIDLQDQVLIRNESILLFADISNEPLVSSNERVVLAGYPRSGDYNEAKLRTNSLLMNTVNEGVAHNTESAFIEYDCEFSLSVVSGSGLELLIGALQDFASRFLSGAEQLLVTRARHREVLQDTLGALDRTKLLAGSEDLLAEELRAAAFALGRLTGRVDVEDVLDVIFRDFCIGK